MKFISVPQSLEWCWVCTIGFNLKILKIAFEFCRTHHQRLPFALQLQTAIFNAWSLRGDSHWRCAVVLMPLLVPGHTLWTQVPEGLSLGDSIHQGQGGFVIGPTRVDHQQLCQFQHLFHLGGPRPHCAASCQVTHKLQCIGSRGLCAGQ